MKSNDIVVDLPLNLSVEQAWNAWTQAGKLEQWLTVKAHIEAHVGGPYELFWQPETPNDNSTIGCKITALVPKKLIAFEWKGPVPFADLMNVQPVPTWVLVSFEAVSPTHSIAHFRHTGWQTGERWEAARQWQTNAWIGAFEALKKLR